MWRRALGLLAVAGLMLALGDCDPYNDSGADARSPGNVRFGACLAGTACGGDPSGQWQLVSACVNPPIDVTSCPGHTEETRGGSSGTLVLDDGSFNLTLRTELSPCGHAESSSDNAGGTYAISGSSINLGGTRALDFCVQGSSLTLSEPTATYPELQVLEFSRID